MEGCCWLPKREQQNASPSSGRNDSHDPNAQASGDRLHSEEYENVKHMTSTGVKLMLDLVTRIEETTRTRPDVLI